MSIKRTVRIDLSQFASGWTDCFVLLTTYGFKETNSIQRKMREYTTKVGLSESIEEQEKVAEEQVDHLVGVVKNAFVSGSIVDEAGQKRDMTVDDIEHLDGEVVKHLLGSALGSITKKN